MQKTLWKSQPINQSRTQLQQTLSSIQNTSCFKHQLCWTALLGCNLCLLGRKRIQPGSTEELTSSKGLRQWARVRIPIFWRNAVLCPGHFLRRFPEEHNTRDVSSPAVFALLCFYIVSHSSVFKHSCLFFLQTDY